MQNTDKYLSVTQVDNPKNSQLTNDLYDDSPLVIIDVITRNERTFDHFRHPQLTRYWSLWMKSFVVDQLGGWDDPVTQALSCRHSNVQYYSLGALRIGLFASLHYPDEPLRNWCESHVKEFLLAVISDALTVERTITRKKARATKSKGKPKLLSFKILDGVLYAIKQTQIAFLTENITDGLTIELPDNFLAYSVSGYVERQGMSYPQWIKSGSYGTVPLPVAMSFLADAINVIESDMTAYLLDYFKLQRQSEHQVNIDSIFGNGCLSFLYSGVAPDRSRGNNQNLISRDQAWLAFADTYRDRIPLQEETGLALKSTMDLSNEVSRAYDACVAIFLMLTGVRISEISSEVVERTPDKPKGALLISLSGDDSNYNPDNYTTTQLFRTRLKKTDDSAFHTRGMSGLVAKAADILCGLSYVKKRNRSDGELLPLFATTYTEPNYKEPQGNIRKPWGTSEATLRKRLKDYYQRFIVTQPELKKIWPHITPHQLRHTFAEFALRRFEGDVLEAIRRHFRHGYGSYFTTKYTFDKLQDETLDLISRDYLREVLEKITSENLVVANNPDFKRNFTGRICALLDEAAKRHHVVSVENLPAFVESMANDIVSFVASAYGYCIVHKNTKSQAKCIDPATKIPLIEKAKFELCSGCPNLCASKQNNKDTIMRKAIVHQRICDTSPYKNIAPVKESAITVKNAERILLKWVD